MDWKLLPTIKTGQLCLRRIDEKKKDIDAIELQDSVFYGLLRREWQKQR